MRPIEKLRRLGTALQALAPPRRARAFVCGDCDYQRRCGLPPGSNCIPRAEQLARNGGRAPSRTVLSEWASWGY